jgi:catechol 2,3-dioxygenase-like lactoylglutathione lyase family enzyme
VPGLRKVVDLAAMDHGIKVSTVNISCPDPPALARFYAALLGTEIRAEEPDWVVLSGGGSIPLSFELDRHYQPPVWPTEPGQPPTQLHLEVQVSDLEGALAHALECGARLAGYQPQDDVRVCLDPAGHPFCLWLDDGEQ